MFKKSINKNIQKSSDEINKINQGFLRDFDQSHAMHTLRFSGNKLSSIFGLLRSKVIAVCSHSDKKALNQLN